MQDEHFMREWNAGHIRFSADVEQSAARIAERLRHRLGGLLSIGQVYSRCMESPLAHKARLTGNAVIGGLATGMSLAVILITLAAIIGPETSHAFTSVCVTPHSLA